MTGLLRRLLADPLTGNGFLLVASSACTSVLGMVFWAVAARTYPAAGVGIASALVAALSVLGTIAQLNLLNTLNRFLPVAGRRSGRLLVAAYAIACLAGLLVGVVFVVGVDTLSPELGRVLTDDGARLWFPAVVALWTVFVLQDGALAGLRAGGTVLASNVAYALLKIVLLLLLVGITPQLGIFWAWTAAAVPVVAVVTVLVLRRAAHAVRTAAGIDGADGVPLTRAMVGRFVVADYTASMVWTVTHGILPVLLLGLVGPTRTAYFALAWAVAYVLQLVSRGMSMSLLTEGAAAPDDLGMLSWRSLVSTLPLLLVGTGGILLTAPLLLRVFGVDYADGGTTLLRLLAVAALPGLVVTLYSAVLRVQRRHAGQVVLAVSLAGPILLGLAPAARWGGLAGVGWLWLAVHTVVAVLVLVTALRRLWTADLPPGLVRVVSGLRVLAHPLRRRRALRWADPVLRHLQTSGVVPSTWVAVSGPVGRSDVVTLWLRDGDDVVGVLKLARTARGRESLHRAGARILQWHERTAGLDLPVRVPRIIDLGAAGHIGYQLESHLSGTVATRMLPLRHDRRSLVTRTLGVDHAIVAATAHVPDPATIRAWTAEPVSVLSWVLVEAGRFDLEESLRQMAAEVDAVLTETAPPAAFVHGDLWLGNVLLHPAQPIGLVDWEGADPDGLPQVDTMTMLVTSRAAEHGREFGSEVLRLLHAPDWTAWEDDLLRRGGVIAGTGTAPAGCLSDRVALQVAWIHHCAKNVAKSVQYQPGTPWFVRNVETVLRTGVRDVGGHQG